MSDDDLPDGEGDVAQDDIDAMFGDDDTAAGDAGAAGAPDGGAMGLDEIEGEGISSQIINDAYEEGEPMAEDVSAIYDIPVQISAVLGRSTMQVSQLLKLGRGAVVELDRKVGEAIDIYVNNRLVARGEVVVVEDKLGVTMTEIVKSDKA